MDTADYYARASYDILRSIARGLSHADEKNEMRKLLAIARLKRDNVRLIDEAIKKAGVALRQEIADEITREVKKLSAEWTEKYQERMILKPLERLEKQIWESTASRLNVVNTTMRLSADKRTSEAFQWLDEERYRALSTGTAEVATGAVSYQDAMRATIRRLAASDLTAFEDKAGRKWSAEAYVSMDISTTLHSARNKAAETVGTQVGATVIYVTTHANARPGCEPYQGRYFSTDGTYGTIYDLHGGAHDYEPLENTTYGEPDGLFGINCKHDRIPVLDGLFRDRSEEEVTNDPDGYEATQKARAMEREIRGLKRMAGIMQAGGQDEDTRNLRRRIDEREELYYRFCRAQGLRERDDRLNIY